MVRKLPIHWALISNGGEARVYRLRRHPHSADAQSPTVDADAQVVAPHAGELHSHHHRLLRLEDVDVGLPAIAA